MMQRPDSTNQRSGPSQTPPTALPVYGDGAARGLNDDATSSSSLGPTDFAKICLHCGGDLRLTPPDWDDAGNAAYVNAINTLLNALRTAFPNKIDMSKITGCKQQPDETVGDFLTSLTILFNQHSGMMPAVSTLSRPSRQDNTENRANFTEPGRGGRGRGRSFSRRPKISRDECLICREKGHWAENCPQRREGGDKNFAESLPN
ncbi:unnamed protein product [Pleuronectes platessa]|uniref:CCHC-type domain-containing protein n=1 Tax=Pleuronectes platessa TaxID=8262 RepID=A0A9N7VFK2_PLEPL|nr:unnamed protein product [Pleuronectes platessa]